MAKTDTFRLNLLSDSAMANHNPVVASTEPAAGPRDGRHQQRAARGLDAYWSRRHRASSGGRRVAAAPRQPGRVAALHGGARGGLQEH